MHHNYNLRSNQKDKLERFFDKENPDVKYYKDSHRIPNKEVYNYEVTIPEQLGIDQEEYIKKHKNDIIDYRLDMDNYNHKKFLENLLNNSYSLKNYWITFRFNGNSGFTEYGTCDGGTLPIDIVKSGLKKISAKIVGDDDVALRCVALRQILLEASERAPGSTPDSAFRLVLQN